MSANTDTDTIQGFTKDGLAEFNAQFHALVDDGKQANVVTLIARHGEIVNHDAYGVLDISATPQVPVKTDSIFRIASMAKPFTAAAMMMLWEQGKWALEDPVSKFIPEFEGLKVKQEDGELVEQASPMTMKQLMCHSAGFGSRPEYDDLRTGDLQDMIDSLAKLPLFLQPGTGWRYGPSVDIQGYIIEKITGRPFDEFLEHILLAPLGMVDTGYVLPESKLERLVSNHKTDENGKLVAVDLPGSYNTSRPKFVGAGGGLMLSTANDYWRFSQMILSGGEFEGKRYLKTSTVDMMHTNALGPDVKLRAFRRERTGLSFGLGFAIVEDPAAVPTSQGVHSYFWSGAYGTLFWIDPVNDLIVIVFLNQASGVTPASIAGAREIAAKAVYKTLKESSGKQAE
jgi:CubicO group peptidase (beta-lactamase class C family)